MASPHNHLHTVLALRLVCVGYTESALPFYFNTTSEVGPRVKLPNCVTRAGKIFFALDRTGAPNENIVQNHLKIELLNVF